LNSKFVLAHVLVCNTAIKESCGKIRIKSDGFIQVADSIAVLALFFL